MVGHTVLSHDSRVHWFGESWGAPICEPETHDRTPVGEPCAWCVERIDFEDSGALVASVGGRRKRIPYHRDCWLRQILGSVAHIERRCSCYRRGASEGDDPKLTKRQAARAAVEAAKRTRGAQ